MFIHPAHLVLSEGRTGMTGWGDLVLVMPSSCVLRLFYLGGTASFGSPAMIRPASPTMIPPCAIDIAPSAMTPFATSPAMGIGLDVGGGNTHAPPAQCQTNARNVKPTPCKCNTAHQPRDHPMAIQCPINAGAPTGHDKARRWYKHQIGPYNNILTISPVPPPADRPYITLKKH